MGDKYNIEDSIEIVNLKKYAEDAVKNKDKEAALEAILLEYSKEIREIDNKVKSIKNEDIKTKETPETFDFEFKSNKTNVYSQTSKITEMVKKNITEIEKEDKKPTSQRFKNNNEKKNAELLRLAFGTSQFDKVEYEQEETIEEIVEEAIDETKNFSEIKEKKVFHQEAEETEEIFEKKEGFFSNVLSRAHQFILDEDEDENEDDIDYDTEEQSNRERQNIENNNEYNQKAILNTEMFEADEYDEVYDFLVKKSIAIRLKTAFSFVFATILILLSAASHFNLHLPSIFMIKADSLIPIFTIFIFTVIIFMNFSVIKDGAIDLFTKRESATSFLFISCLILFIHSMYSFTGNVLRKEDFVSYAGVAALAFFTYNFGRLLWTNAHLKNFEEIYSASSSLVEVRNVKEDEELKKIANRFVNEDTKNFYYNVSVGSCGGFLNHATDGEKDIAFKKHMILILIMIIFALSIIFSFLKGFNNIIVILVSVFAMLTPVNSELVGSIVFYKASKKARKTGAVIAGASVANEKQGIEAIMLRDRDIFRDGSVVIKGFRVISSEYINHIISYVASIFVTIDSPAKIAFMDLIDNKENLLKEVYFFECFESEGIIAFIDGDKILLGNYDFMIKNAIIPPDDALKNFKTGRSRSNMYVAQNGQLVCVFSIGYLLDKEIEGALNDMEKEYIKAAVATFDPNLNAPLLCKRFSLDDDTLSIMRSGDVMKFNKNDENDDKIGRSGLYLTKRDAAGFVGIIKAIKSISFLSKTNHLIMIASIIAAPVLWSIVVVLGGLLQITAFAVIIFHFLWCIPVFVNSLFA